MLAWMLYAIVASTLIGAAAFALEHAMHGMRRPTRFVWVGAMILSAVWPALMLSVPRTDAFDAPESSIRASVSGGVHTVSNTVALASQRALNVSVETIVLTIWALLSALLVARVIHAFYSNAIRSRGWRFATVDGIQVRTSTDVGPAVVGIASMEVVLPEWVLALDRALLDLVLAHEQEHRDARDPILLFGAATVVCLMPWNIGLIWQARRLRSAMEIDCDARVLRRYPDTERYGLLLLAIAQRRSPAFPVLGPTMSEPAANLSRRFAAMKNNPVSRVRLAALSAFGVAAIVAACAIDAPTTPGPEMSTGASLLLASARTDTAEPMRFCVDAFNGYPGICLDFPKRPFDDRRMLELSERLEVDYTKTLQRTGSKDAALESVQGVIAQIEKLIGEPVQVTIGDTKLLTPGREVATKEPAAFGKKKESYEMTAIFKTDSAGKITLADAEATTKFQEPKAELEKVHLDSAWLIKGTFNPVFPELLKRSGIAGEVVVSFVVDENGRVELGTLRVLKSTHALFTEAVRKALAEARYNPATANGRRVRQLIEVPVAFSIK